MGSRSLWWWVVMMATVFAMGTSGSWLGIQTANAMGVNWGWFGWAWGVFGAAITGIAMYGGVRLITHGNSRGYLVVIVAGAALITMDFRFFEGHGDAAYILGVFPTALALVAGMVETQHSKQQELQQKEKDTSHEQRRQQIEDDERKHRYEMDRLRLQLELEKAATVAQLSRAGETQSQPPATNGATPLQRSATTSKFDLACALLTQYGGNISYADLADQVGISEATARTYKGRWAEKTSVPATVADGCNTVSEVSNNGNGNGNGH